MPLDARSDIYSFGCLAYRVLAGRDVFEEAGAIAQLVAHASAEPTSLDVVAPRPIPPELAALVMQCLRKDVAARPASMREIAQRLDAIVPSAPWTPEQASAFWAACRASEVDAIGAASTLAAE